LISALAVGVFLMPYFKPPWAKLTLSGFVDFIRRYWLHLLIALVIYNAKDWLDQIDRMLMARTGLDMTPYIYAIEGDLVVLFQDAFRATWLDVFMTHFYIAGFMFITYASIFYVTYFDDRWMADRVALCVAWVYLLAIPFYLFFNVRVTGFYIEDMDAIAYTLNPEIEDWFRRIDAFTNCMPSLHIAVPFAIWLTFRKHDHDGRWSRFQNMTLGYIILTAFAIIYLGIHWFVDIIGGMILATFAVSLMEKTNDPVWKFFDERTINSRLATLLTRPAHSTSLLFGRIKNYAKAWLKPTSKETGTFIVIIMILTAAVITWDLTHNELPAEGVQSAQGAVASEGWLATMDNQSGEAIVLIHDVADPLSNPSTVAQPLMQFDSPYALFENYLVMANESQLRVIDVDEPSTVLLQQDVTGIQSLQMTSLQGKPVVLYIANDALHAVNIDGQDVQVPSLPNSETVHLMSVSGIEILLVSEEQPDTLRIGTIGTSGSLNIIMNASTTAEQNLELEEWGQIVDENNASIEQVSFDSQHIAVRMNVSALDRMVIYDRSTGEQWLGFDPIYPVGNLSMGYGYVVWEAKDHYNPLSFTDKYGDWEIHQLHLATNYSEQLTSDTIDQVNPIALEGGLAYIEVEDDGEVTINVLTRGTELATYSSLVLQWSVLLLIALTFIYIIQRQDEVRSKDIIRDNVLESE
ncbi:MAG: phosphatase PAP2 family protein, partial [Candidatus Thermoplasmatota archaeon]|nr:phosphatase PAP2 family protein [Candidatus Thermoplasmatota archaeon]